MAKLVEQFAIKSEQQLPLRYNIAPSQLVATVRAVGPEKERQLALLKWGLVPSWADDPAIGNRLINARGDSVAVKPSFRAAFKKRRCLVLADGYYEWQKVGKKKQPYLIHKKDDQPFAFAGIWEQWFGDESGEPLESCSIITTDASDSVKHIHDRMPVILDAVDYDLWLDPGVDDRTVLEPLLVPYDSPDFIADPVDSRVNNPKNDDAKCVERVSVTAADEKKAMPAKSQKTPKDSDGQLPLFS